MLAKTGTTILRLPSGDGIELKAQNLAGYITTKRGEHLAFALMVNDVGPVASIEDEVAGVFEDEARITNAIYQEAG